MAVVKPKAGADGIRGALTTKALGIPAWAWGIGLGLSILAVRAVMARRQTPEIPTDEDSEAGDPTTDGAGGYADLGGSAPVTGSIWAPSPASSGTFDPAQPSVTPRAPSDFDSNAEWATAASEWATVNKRSWSPLDVQGAISLWLDGAYMEQYQAGIINTLIREFMAPPDMPPAPRVRPPAPATKPPTPPKPTTPPVAAKPGAVRNLKTGSVTRAANGGWVTALSWAPPQGAVTSYQIERSLDNGTTWKILTKTQKGSPYSTAVSVTVPATLYRVAANRGGAVGPWTTASARRPAGATPTPTPAPTPAPAAGTKHVIRSGDTLWSLCNRYYGRATMGAVRAVAAANRLTLSGAGTSVQPSPWRIGQTVNFPPKASITF